MDAMRQGPVIDVYARISKAPDGSVEKTDRQIADCKAELERRGLTMGKVFQDPNLSAWKRGVSRPGWNSLLKRLDSREAPDGVIVWKLDRFMRRVEDLVHLRNLAKEGFSILTCMEGSYDFERNYTATLIRVHINEESSKDTSDRVKRGILASRINGKAHTGPRAFGWPAAPKEGEEPTSPELVDQERKAIAEGVRRYLKDDELNVIGRDWNEHGILTATGGQWNGQLVRQMLARARNFGLIEHNGEIIGTLDEEPAAHRDPKRARELYDLVHAKMAGAKRGRPVSDKRLLTGIALCGNCGRHINSRTRAGRYYTDGQPRVMYYCPWPRGCGKVSIAQPDTDLALEAFVVKRLADPKHASQIAAQAQAVRDIDEQIAEIRETQNMLDDRLLKHEIDRDRWDRMNAPLAKQLEELRERAAQAEAPDPTLTVPGAQAAVRNRWKRAETPERRALLKAALGTRKLFIDPVPEGRHWRQVKVSDRLRVE